MRKRGFKYWDWADCTLHSRCHIEWLADRTLIDVQARLSRMGVTQLFLGAYAQGGELIFEEYHNSRCGETISQALLWGQERARSLLLSPANMLVLPRRGTYRAY